MREKRPNSYREKETWPEVDGCQWIDQKDGYGVRVIRDGDPVPEETCINVPHPVRKNMRIIFCVIAVVSALACIIARIPIQ